MVYYTKWFYDVNRKYPPLVRRRARIVTGDAYCQNEPTPGISKDTDNLAMNHATQLRAGSST
jgi:hypothetical protein